MFLAFRQVLGFAYLLVYNISLVSTRIKKLFYSDSSDHNRFNSYQGVFDFDGDRVGVNLHYDSVDEVIDRAISNDRHYVTSCGQLIIYWGL